MHLLQSPVSYTPVRLSGGSGPNEGRVEIYHDGTWGTICDDSWDINDANVVCRQLGYPSAREGAVFSVSNKFGAGSGHIFLDDVRCVGTEESLGRCANGGWYNQNCDHSEDVGIVCNLESSGKIIMIVVMKQAL